MLTLVMIVCFHLLYLILPLACTFGPLVLLYSSHYRLYGAVWAAAYAAWFAISAPSERDGKGRPWHAFEDLWFWRLLFSWFPMRIVVTQPLPPSGQYVFGVHPHGGLAFNRGMFGFSTRPLWKPAFAGIDFRVLTATAAFRIPVIRELWLWSCCITYHVGPRYCSTREARRSSS